MADDELMLRINVSGEWYAHEWWEFISAVDNLYLDLVILETIRQLTITPPPTEDVSTRMQSMVDILLDPSPNRRGLYRDGLLVIDPKRRYDPPGLRVAAIQYGPEGKVDLVGIRQVVEATVDVIEAFIEFAGISPEHDKKKLANIQKKVEIIKAAGYSEKDVANYAYSLIHKHDSILIRKLIDSGRIKQPQALPPPSDWQDRRLPPAPAQG